MNLDENKGILFRTKVKNPRKFEKQSPALVATRASVTKVNREAKAA